jgi:hypothetical protein
MSDKNITKFRQHAKKRLFDNRNNSEQESLLSRDPHMHSPVRAITVDPCLPGNGYGPWR